MSEGLGVQPETEPLFSDAEPLPAPLKDQDSSLHRSEVLATELDLRPPRSQNMQESLRAVLRRHY